MRKSIISLSVLLAAALPGMAFGQSATITSVWSSTEGQLNFTQQGQSVTGTYRGGGKITGTVTGSRLSGFWVEPNSAQRCSTPRNGSFYWGRLVFNFISGNGAFQGLRSYCDRAVTGSDRTWNGNLQRIKVAGMSGVTRPITLPTGQGVPIVTVTPGPVGPGPITNPVNGPQPKPCYTNSGAIASVAPCTSRVGSTLTVRQLRAPPTPIVGLAFRAVLANGVPAKITAPLTAGPGGTFNAVVPASLCARGGPSWTVDLLTTAGARGLGEIGSFQPDCR